MERVDFQQLEAFTFIKYILLNIFLLPPMVVWDNGRKTYWMYLHFDVCLRAHFSMLVKKMKAYRVNCHTNAHSVEISLR